MPRHVAFAKKSLAVLAMLMVISGALFAPRAEAAESHAVVFMYHKFGEDRYPSTNVTLEQFTTHLDYLENNGFKVWPLARVVKHLREGTPLPDKTVAITIDDAYLSVYENAWPLLKERGWPFTVFVPTGAVDKGYQGYMSWDQMREMARGGATFASHSVSHGYLMNRKAGETRDEWRERMRREITESAARIEEEIGSAEKFFAYPFGEFDRDLAILVAELGFVGFGQQSGAVGPYSDPRAYPRYPIAEAYAAIEDFDVKAKSLALPVRSVRPWDPVTTDTRPALEAELADSGARLDRLSCFVSSQGRVRVEWLDRSERRFRVRPPEPLGTGRSRYNCTAPSSEGGRYYWYSHPWLVVEE